MKYLIDLTIDIFDFLLPDHSPRQKTNTLRFLHGIFLFFILTIFLFSPSRSMIRYVIMCILIAILSLYFIYSECWWSVVEQTYSETDVNVMDVLLDLIGCPINQDTRETITRTNYLLCFYVGFCLMLKDLFYE